MPRVSDSHKQARRRQILEAARSCFAKRGYQTTTVRDLEAASGLSSGAIFNYFASKQEIFLALAEQEATQLADDLATGGLRRVVERAGQARAVYSASYLEVGRELATDVEFRRRWQQRGQVVMGAFRTRLEAGQADGTVRTDLPFDDLVTYSALTLDGLLLQLRLGTSPPELETSLLLHEQSLRP
jgi:AcrR family transcriptional regulator